MKEWEYLFVIYRLFSINRLDMLYQEKAQVNSIQSQQTVLHLGSRW